MTNVDNEEQTSSAAAALHHVATESSIEATREALKFGPRGALTIASITITLLILGWLSFYFFLFMPRGDIG